MRRAAWAAGVYRALPPTVQGMVMMLVSALLFSAGNAVIKHLSPGIPAQQIVFFRAFFSLLILVPIVWRAGGWASLRTARLPLHLARGVLQTVSMLMFFAGIAGTPLVLVNALEFTAPLFATLFAVLLLGEAVRLRRTLALAAGFAGALVALWPQLSTTGLAALEGGAGLILGSAVIWAVVLITIRRLGTTESSITQSVYMGLVLTPLSGVLAAVTWVTPSWGEMGWIVVVSFTATFGQLAYIQAFRLAEMSAVLPLDFSKLIWSAALGLLVFAEWPEPVIVLGGAIIFAAGAYITLREAQLARRMAAAAPAAARAPAD